MYFVLLKLTSTSVPISYPFTFDGWISKKEGLEHELSIFNGIPYRFVVETGDIQYAGTNANVFVEVIGSLGKTVKTYLKKDSAEIQRDLFERGQSDAFNLSVSVLLFEHITCMHLCIYIIKIFVMVNVSVDPS